MRAAALYLEGRVDPSHGAVDAVRQDAEPLRQNLAVEPQENAALEIGTAQQRSPEIGTALRVAVVREMPHLLLLSGNLGGRQIADQIGQHGRLLQVIPQDPGDSGLEIAGRQPPGIRVFLASVGDQPARDVVAQALAVLAEMARGQSIPGLVEKLADQRRPFGCMRSATGTGCLGGKALLERVPNGRIDDRRMLAFVDLVAVPDAADIERIGQDLVHMAATEGRPAGRTAEVDGLASVR